MNKIKITKKDLNKCLDFSVNIIKSSNQYNRLNEEEDLNIQRTCVGKIAEVAYLKFIRENFNSEYPEGDMFKIYKGSANVDRFDFITSSKETVDIKTAYLPHHKLIFIPEDQFKNLPKDYYVGIKLNGKFLKQNDLEQVDLNSITEAEIIGVLSRKDVIDISLDREWKYPAKACPLKEFKKHTLEY